MKGSAALCSRSGARIPLPIITPFVCHEGIKRRYESSLASGTTLGVCLEGPTGAAKGEIMWRLHSQGYRTAALPFVDWLQREGVSSEQIRSSPDVLMKCSERWQDELDALIDASVTAKESVGRPGLLFVSRSLMTSSRELQHRGLVSHRQVRTIESVIIIGLHADAIKRARRVAEKTFSDPNSEPSKLRTSLASYPQHPLEKLEHSLDSTSSKQFVANLLTYIGVPTPVFPPRD